MDIGKNIGLSANDNANKMDARSQSAYFAVLSHAAKCGFTINRTKIAKLLYLADLYQVENGNPKITSIRWTWQKFGPYSGVFFDAERRLVEEKVIESRPYLSPRSNKIGHDLCLLSDKYDSLPFNETHVLEMIVEKFGHLSADEIKKVTYRTRPMVRATTAGINDVELDLNDRSSIDKPTRSRRIKRVIRQRHHSSTEKEQKHLLAVIDGFAELQATNTAEKVR